jgi:2-iminobutanoate/2-iminopropanoate deaminase
MYCTSQEFFAPINEVYVKYFPTNWPARMFLCVQPWAGRFDVEMTCVAAV